MVQGLFELDRNLFRIYVIWFVVKFSTDLFCVGSKHFGQNDKMGNKSSKLNDKIGCL